MRIFRGFHHKDLAPACALTIGNFDGVHRGHQAMLALLRSEAQHRRLPSCVMTFEPHPRDFFVAQKGLPASSAPARIATLRDKLAVLQACDIDQCVILPFNLSLASLSAPSFMQDILARGLGAKYVLVGDDFRFGAQRAGDYNMLTQYGKKLGFDVARMNSFEIPNLEAQSKISDSQPTIRVSSSAARDALRRGELNEVTQLLGRPYTLSGHVVHGRKLGRKLQFPTLNIRMGHWNPATSGIFVVQVHDLHSKPLMGVANLGVRPTLDANDSNAGRVLLETHCLEWPQEWDMNHGYGKIIRVDLLHKLHDEKKYDSLEELKKGIAQDIETAQAWYQNYLKTSG
ncbi:MAG: bifunctional riboflavin kinase/FAD synthetase [Limnohabitans sp.]|nr:bifunctional riboflavin kinase/FAD synthetase [Limnohabitans sp.]